MLSVITATGGRPEAFRLCEYYMSRQTFRDIEWIVVDDCDPPTVCTMGQKVIRPRPVWNGSGCTMGRNIAAAFEICRGDRIAIFEDDDWYSPLHLETLNEALNGADLAGSVPARYYHVSSHLYKVLRN